MKNIQFIPIYESSFNTCKPPIQSKKEIPEWYKNIKSFYKEKLKISDSGMVTNSNVKMCVPFFDSLSFGYMQKTWCDILIRKNNDQEIEYVSANYPQVLSTRPAVNIPIDSSFYGVEFIWKNPWIPKLPKGYSVLITHPFNRLDLPFYTLSGIIDSDNFYHMPSFGEANVPFYLKKDFEGIIPAGTPMFQIFPFKRDDWTMETLQYDKNFSDKNGWKLKKHFYGVYKKYFWVNKKFN